MSNKPPSNFEINATIEKSIQLAVQLHGGGRFIDAEKIYKQVLQIAPNHPVALHLLGVIFHQRGNNAAAVELIQKALDTKPDYADAHCNLGIVMKALNRNDEAIACYQKAISLRPRYGEAHNNLGNVYANMGRREDAIESYRNAITINPNYAEACRHLAFAKTFDDYDSDVKAMENAYAANAHNESQRMHVAFALGKAFEDIGQYEKSFSFLSEANSIRRKMIHYDHSKTRLAFERMRTLFSRDFLEAHRDEGISDSTPIFIVGMPRSGTSLVEQILASHPHIYGAGELSSLHDILVPAFGPMENPEFFDKIQNAKRNVFQNCASEYLGQLRKHDKTALMITDKMPWNFRFVGLIHIMFPNAKIVHCCREPIDTCLSVFKNYFSVEGQGYAYDQRELGAYYNEYKDLMEHWRKVLPNVICDVQYEDLVADQKEQTQRLLSFLGLDWNDSCLNFHKTKRHVQTASNAQVFRPIYSSSISVWKNFESQLEPLISTLNKGRS